MDQNPNTGRPINEVPWRIKDAIAGVLLLLPLTVIVGGVIYAAGQLLLPGAGLRRPLLEISAFAIATTLSGFGLVWWIGLKKRGGNWRNLGFTDLKLWFDVPLAVLGEIFIFVGLSIYGLLLLKGLGLQVPEQPVVKLFGRSRAGLSLAVLYVAIMAPLVEEVFFRGFVYTAFRRQWGKNKAVLASSAIFAAFHVEPLLFVPMFVIGAVLALVYELRGSLAPNLLLHAFNNLLALLVTYAS